MRSQPPHISSTLPWLHHFQLGYDQGSERMRAWNKLSASFVRSADSPGRWSDGGGLYLQCANGGKSWVFQYERPGRARAMGLGNVRSVSLALARELAADCRVSLARGLDPIEARKAASLAARAAHAKEMTFRQ